MARRHKPSFSARLTPAELKARLRRAEQEGRYQQALDLAKSLYKDDPSPEHQELYKRMILGRARQQRAQGHFPESRTTLENAAGLDPGQAWQEQLAQELAANGAAGRALELLRPFPDSPALPHVLALAADAALGQGKAGRSLLPEALRPQFDAVQQAFAQAEAGQDEAARATLQGIGLQSPFLEWKLLLRGLLAYYQNEDARALENWQRLTPERLPARLASPLRFAIDPAYRLAQAPAVQTTLQRQADRLQQSGLIQPLRTLQTALANERQLPQAFRLAENLLAALRQEAPHLVPRLAACFYWSVIQSGRPEDLPRLQRVFGPPADDPSLSRLEALALEHRGQLDEAHKAWKEYQQEVSRHPRTWPGEQGDRVRALIWYHMGLNAARIPDDSDLAKLPAFLRNHPDRPRPLKPGAAECFQRSLELAPDQRETYEALFDFWQRKKKTAEAIKVGKQLLERFPDHVPTLEAMGDLYTTQKKFRPALEMLQEALKHNPLERRLRKKVGTGHLLKARQHAEAGEFDEARREYQAALDLEEGKKEPAVLCKWAACEFKAGDADRAEQLIQEALSGDGGRLPVAYNLLIEAIRLKLPRALKTRFDREFKEALAEPPSAAAAASVAKTAATHVLAGVTYLGQKTHEKKVTAYLDRAAALDFTQPQLLDVCVSLSSLDARRLEQKYLRLGQKKFPADPYFVLGEAELNIDQGPGSFSPWRTEELLNRAQELATVLPHDARRTELLERIKHLRQMVEMSNPFSRISSMMDDLMDSFGYGDEDDYDEDDEEEWDEPFF